MKIYKFLTNAVFLIRIFAALTLAVTMADVLWGIQTRNIFVSVPQGLQERTVK